MEERDLVRAVARQTRLSREESADVTRAVLEGLAGQISEAEARRVTRELPDQLTGQLRVPQRRGNQAHPVAVEDFIRQVSEHTGLTDEDARDGTGAVLTTLRDALGEEDYGHLTGQLPAGYARLVRQS